MSDAFMDVFLELDVEELARERDPIRFVMELARSEVDDRCAREGARRRDGAPEMVVGRGVHPTTGRDLVLVSTRWPVTCPDGLVARTG